MDNLAPQVDEGATIASSVPLVLMREDYAGNVEHSFNYVFEP